MKRHKRNYKDSVFVDLFSSCKDSKKNFLSLYSALSGKELPDDTNIENIKLRSSVYKGYVNDVAYNVGGKVIVLLEHQSTVNPNMPQVISAGFTKGSLSRKINIPPGL